jgi:hypothetical protein
MCWHEGSLFSPLHRSNRPGPSKPAAASFRIILLRQLSPPIRSLPLRTGAKPSLRYILRFLITVLGIEESYERRAGPVSKTESWCRHTFASPLFFSQVPNNLRHHEERFSCSGGTAPSPCSSEALTGRSQASLADLVAGWCFRRRGRRGCNQLDFPADS